MTNLFTKLIALSVASLILVGCACPNGLAILPSERIKQLEAELAMCEEKLARCEANFSVK
jgi:hypothetical protein